VSSHTVSVVMLTWNHQPVSVEAIGHVLMNASVSTQLVVVDNASQDDTPSFLRRLPARMGAVDIQVLYNPVNVGYPVGVNQGLAIADGEYVVLLNNDVLVPRYWDQDLIADLNAHPRLGGIGPVSNRVSGPQLRRARYRPSAFLSYAAAWRDQAGHSVQAASRLVGFCLMVRRSVLDRIGGMDMRFSPGMFEDDDFGVRAQLAGFQLGISTRVFVHHFGSVSFGDDQDQARRLLLAHQRLFRRKWRTADNPAEHLRLPYRLDVVPRDGPAVRALAPDFALPERRALAWAGLLGRFGDALPWLVPVDADLEDPTRVERAFAEVRRGLGADRAGTVELAVERYPYPGFWSRAASPGSRLVLSGVGLDGWAEMMLPPYGIAVENRSDPLSERVFQALWKEIGRAPA